MEVGIEEVPLSAQFDKLLDHEVKTRTHCHEVLREIKNLPSLLIFSTISLL